MDEQTLKILWLTVLPVHPGPGKPMGNIDEKTQEVRFAKYLGVGSGK